MHVDRPRHAAYIDDLMLFGTNRDQLLTIQQRYCDVMESVGLSPKRSKVIRPTCDIVTCLGYDINGRTGDIGVNVIKLNNLVHATRSIINDGYCTGVAMSELIGRWVWSMLIRRPSLSILSSVYRFIEVAGRARFQVWPSVAHELDQLCNMVILLYSNCRAKWWDRIICSDASEIAQGVVSQRVNYDIDDFRCRSFVSTASTNTI